uniref:Uncharacterized protein n=1 Tax=Arundo donax TaxID=35708 RepID=A0A0A8ZMQ0_ARUDO
MRLRVLIMSG